jgi:hypothetical protein
VGSYQTNKLKELGMSDSSAASLVYEVVSPLGESIAEKRNTDARVEAKSGKFAPAAPLRGLNYKKIGLVWSAFTNGNVFLEAMQGLLAARFNGLEFVKLPGGKGLHWGDHPDESMADLAKEARLDAAIAAVGG